MTEAGAVSAVAAFFRQNLDACAWAEEPTPPPFDTAAASPGAPPLLRFSVRSKGFKSAVGALDDSSGSDGATALPAACSRGGAGGGRAAAPLELVVSRGPGPTFSEHETRVARYAALLLSQALARIRDRAALSEAQSALEDSFRSMQEASDAVAVLVEERERRAQLEAQQGADLEDRHYKELSAAEGALERARREAERLRGQLDAAGESLAVVSEAAGDVRRAVSDAVAARGPGVGAEGQAGLSDEEVRSKVVAVIERSARDALRCSSARVMRRRSSAVASTEAGPAAAAEGAKAVDRSSARAAADGRDADDDEGGDREPRSSSARHGGDEVEPVAQLHVPVPVHDSCVAGPLFLSIHGASSPRQRFTGRDRASASALAACLGTALLAVREREEKRRVLRQAEAGHHAAAVSTAAAAAEAHKRGERAVSGMRALVAAAQLSKAQAEASASATGRAERHTDALGHLLSELDAAGGDHSAVARAVHAHAGAAVPGCVGAALLTPRRDSRDGGGEGAGSSLPFSPDPRAWATAAAASGRGRAAAHGSGKDGQRGSKAFGRRWAKRVERAVARAAATGKAVCVGSSSSGDADASEGGAGAGAGDGDLSRRSGVVCFSPVLGGLCLERERKVDASIRSGGPFISNASTCLDRMETTELQAGGAISGRTQTPCLIAWMLRPGAGGEVRDGVGNIDKESSGTPWGAAASPLTDENDSRTPAVAEPPPPALLPPRVSTAMEAVVHAVDLALSACGAATTAAARGTHRQPGRWNAPPARRRQPGHERGSGAAEDDAAAAASKEMERSHRDEELRRLRAGTTALADRVRTLEGRAAGLRASEARSSAALARARADAGAVRGELELATLELQRARRQPLAARSVENSPPPWNRAGGGSGGLSGGSRAPLRGPLREPAKTLGVVSSQLCGREEVSSGRIVYAGVGEGGGFGFFPAATPAAGSGGATTSGGEKTERKAAQRALSSGGGGGGAAFATAAVLPAPAPADASSSAALQHMASVHARLSSSLKSSRRPPPPRRRNPEQREPRGLSCWVLSSRGGCQGIYVCK